MKAYFRNKWTIAGLMLALFGWGPFCIVLVLRLTGSWPGAHLTGFGLLLFATLWPAIVCLVLGALQTRGEPETRDREQD